MGIENSFLSYFKFLFGIQYRHLNQMKSLDNSQGQFPRGGAKASDKWNDNTSPLSPQSVE